MQNTNASRLIAFVLCKMDNVTRERRRRRRRRQSLLSYSRGYRLTFALSGDGEWSSIVSPTRARRWPQWPRPLLAGEHASAYVNIARSGQWKEREITKIKIKCWICRKKLDSCRKPRKNEIYYFITHQIPSETCTYPAIRRLIKSADRYSETVRVFGWTECAHWREIARMVFV